MFGSTPIYVSSEAETGLQVRTKLRPPTPRRHSSLEEVSAAPYVPPFRLPSEVHSYGAEKKKIQHFWGENNLIGTKNKNYVSPKSGPHF